MRNFLLFASLFVLTACASGQVRETLGLKRDAPNAFKVVSRPPLSVPPTFTLAKPEPGAPPRLQVNPAKEASRIFLQDDGSIEIGRETETLESSDVETAITSVIEADMPSSAESLLLEKLGTDAIDPEIRSKLYHDERTPPEAINDSADVTFFERLIGDENEAQLIDPFKEAERILENKEAGKPINEGEVPVIDNSKGSVIDQIF